MRTIGLMSTILLMVGCGGASDEGAKEPTPILVEPASEASPGMTEEAIPPAESAVPPIEEPIAARALMTPAPVVAIAELMSIPGGAPVGTMRFEVEDGKVALSGQFAGLKPGAKAVYIHDVGDCGNKGKAAGGHFNPTKARHGSVGATDRHAGDFGDLPVDDSGNATFTIATDSLTLEADSPDSVIGRSIIIHARKDNKKGDAGAAIACGVIKLESGDTMEPGRTPTQ